MPCLLRATILHPDLNPGSIPKIAFSPKGDANNNSRKLSAKTKIDFSSAICLVCNLISASILGFNNRLYPSIIDSFN